MTHPESDGVVEMLEGGIRAVSTGALRAVEVAQRHHQAAARDRAEELRRNTAQTGEVRRALTAVDDVARTGMGPTGQQRATREPIDPNAAVSSGDCRGFRPDFADPAKTDLPSYGDLPAYLEVYAQAAQEAARTGAQPDPAELHHRAVKEFPKPYQERTAASRKQANARDMAHLRHHLAGDSHIHDRHEPALFAAPAPTADPAAAASPHDTVEARQARASAVRAQVYDSDTTESAILHDLSFGTPAAATARTPTAAASKQAKPPAAKRSYTRSQQMSR